jgi:hypothetical protein
LSACPENRANVQKMFYPSQKIVLMLTKYSTSLKKLFTCPKYRTVEDNIMGGGQNVLDTSTIFSDAITIFWVGLIIFSTGSQIFGRGTIFSGHPHHFSERRIFSEEQYFLDMRQLLRIGYNFLDSRTFFWRIAQVLCSRTK